ncbi:hypothetical protein, partial [Rhodopirellula sallentina]|uniref:hypothetical protein n=1 Tax=Rhodopirellula sallentina TaxID=1263869 RepID=UPI001F29CE32
VTERTQQPHRQPKVLVLFEVSAGDVRLDQKAVINELATPTGVGKTSASLEPLSRSLLREYLGAAIATVRATAIVFLLKLGGVVPTHPTTAPESPFRLKEIS